MNKTAKHENEYTIDLMQLVNALLKKWWIMAVCSLLVAALFFCGTYLFVAPQYTASALMYVNNNTLDLSVTKISTSDLSVSRSLIATYSVIAKARLTLEEVISEAGLNYSCEKLKGMVTLSAESNTEIFAIKVTSTDPEEACLIANTFARVLPGKIESIVNGASAKLVDSAIAPVNPSSPNYGRQTALGFVIGLVIGAAYILLVEFLDDTVKSSDWLIQNFGEEIPLLTVVPDASVSSSGSYGKGYGYGYEDSYRKAKSDSAKKASEANPAPEEITGNGGDEE